MPQPLDIRIGRVEAYTPWVGAGLGLLLPHLNQELTPDPIPKVVLDEIIDSPDREQLIATQRSARIVGAATLNLSVALTGRQAYLYDFVVAPDFQGKGVGFALWREVLAWCRERELDTLELHCPPDRTQARDFYARQGAVPVGDATFVAFPYDVVQ